METLGALLPLIGIALIFWLLIIRPQQRRQAQLRSLQQGLQVGSRVVLAAGLYGVVRSIAEDRVELEVADGVVVTAARASVVQVLDDGTA